VEPSTSAGTGKKVGRLAMLVTGFPSESAPSKGIFNLRAAQSIGRLADLTVVHLRAWRPGRRRFSVGEYAGVKVWTVAVPMLPKSVGLSVLMARGGGWSAVSKLFKECDLVHSVGAGVAGPLASAWGRKAGIFHVTQLMGTDVNAILPKTKGFPGTLGWEKYLHGVACNSNALVHAFQALYPNAQNICTVYRGVDSNTFTPIGEALGPQADCPPVRYLFLGGLPAYNSISANGANIKGGETLLSAWKAAEQELMAAGATLVFAGPSSNGEQATSWRASLKHPENVFLTGSLPPEAIPGYMRAADVVLIPSMQEGLPNVAMEASASGKPVFGSEVGGMPEVVLSGGTGLLLPAGQITPWKDAISNYAKRSEELKRLGEAARQRMITEFNRDSYAPKMMELYAAAMSLPRN
jgi:glycosyltransferase involved in cell wall biosynthesis